MSSAVLVMAKKQGPGGRRGRPKGSVSPGGRKDTVFAVRGTEEYRAWLKAFAEFCRVDMADVFDAAVAEYAKQRGFRPPPKR